MAELFGRCIIIFIIIALVLVVVAVAFAVVVAVAVAVGAKRPPQFYISQLPIDRLCGCYWYMAVSHLLGGTEPALHQEPAGLGGLLPVSAGSRRPPVCTSSSVQIRLIADDRQRSLRVHNSRIGFFKFPKTLKGGYSR